MAANRKPGSRPSLIHCEYCGEDYSSTYRRCPFCDEYDEYEEMESTSSDYRSAPRSRGKRVAQSRRRGGGYTRVSPFQIVAVLLSLAVIIAAIWIVVTQLGPLINRGNVDTIDPDAPGTHQTSPSPETTPPVEQPDVSPEPGTEVVPPDVSSEPEQPQIPAGDTATGFTLHKTDFSFTAKYPDPITLKVTFIPEGTTAGITWSSSNPDIASVDANGKVTHGTKKGTATITAQMASGVKQTCKVYNQLSGSTSTEQPSPSPSQSGSASTTYKVNNADFTFYREGESYKLKVVDYSGSVTWSSSNTSVATVGSDGLCKAVGNGTCNVIGTLEDGSTVKAIVRVKIS